MRDDGVLWVAKAAPSRSLGGKLKPGGPQRELRRLAGAAYAIDPMRDPLEPSIFDESRKGGVADADGSSLAPRDQPGLSFCELGKPLYRPRHTAKDTVIGLFCRYFSAIRGWRL